MTNDAFPLTREEWEQIRGSFAFSRTWAKEKKSRQFELERAIIRQKERQDRRSTLNEY